MCEKWVQTTTVRVEGSQRYRVKLSLLRPEEYRRAVGKAAVELEPEKLVVDLRFSRSRAE